MKKTDFNAQFERAIDSTSLLGETKDRASKKDISIEKKEADKLFKKLKVQL